MKVEKQLNFAERTLVLGVPDFDVIPNVVNSEGQKFNVIGTSMGVKLPFLSLEIEKTTTNLIGKTITA